MRDDIVLSVKGVNKSFSGVQVLKDINLDIRRGEVHVLVGENGAGKSTLMKIITGIYDMDDGEIWFEGKKVDIRAPKDAQELGISIIHQEFNLLGHRSVSQNIFLGREPISRKFLIQEAEMDREAKELLDSLGVDIDPRTKIASLGVAQQQMVEVAKALSFRSKVLIMDEPTATLTSKEIEKLFAAIRRLKEDGVSIVYISHRLEEFQHIAGRRLDLLPSGPRGIARKNHPVIPPPFRQAVRTAADGVFVEFLPVLLHGLARHRRPVGHRRQPREHVQRLL